jgi:hypothetical protein
VSDNVVKHPCHKFNIELRTKDGINYLIVYRLLTNGLRKDSHIFMCPSNGFFLNGDIIEWNSEQIVGIKNHKKSSSTANRKIEIIDSNFFNKLLDKHINRE